ncbi:phage tail protein [Paraburkholderia silviterrae]|uniref:Phage tail protein n=1 Tax=Paraburkholderia silviterrae TaxID=2528715 RepID=A0A4R5ME40_9BURK|nr:phage tail protein [Paraburkholderia silviterrae]TDG25366.1 phage tail protein [Paraburkholderia silviterrae]
MADTFTWVPTVAQSTGTATQRVRKAQFGDGYAQRVQDGINNRSSSFQLQFINDAATIAAIIAFLDARAGATAFLWTPPLRTQALLFTCETYTEPTKDGNAYTFTATFDQTFAP